METIATIATAVPPYRMTCVDVKQAVQKVFPIAPHRLDAVMQLFDHAQVAQRYSVLPLDELIRPRSLTERTREYQEHAIALGRRVTVDCLAQAGLRPDEIDLLITVSCTGYMIPSLDAYLIGALGFRPDVRRLPITELGCVGGAMALSHAREFVRACPGRNALVITVELSSLTFQPHDRSQDNLIACALFGDGAAAALVTSRAMPGVRIIDTASCLAPNTLDVMGFDLRDQGFHMVLAKSVPEILRGQIRPLIEPFLNRHGLRSGQLAAFVLHPGGKKILDYLEQELSIEREKVQPSWDVLREYGNLSSATILFVLRDWLTRRRLNPGVYGLMAGFGPGLSTELLLLQWV
ncbi:MAG TPA: 3-oxoacyl-[acyl-carrier-protein] synthase III C-terminal domain-containing protein [Roseiflexaceae bacterium]|nr:3-oxoacyl-[acyl-carrier-protein] synthase III C-terminal domain-containing protein [Roseiflexaceae bacterium]